MVLLEVRPYAGVQFNLGRETFLVPIVWEKDSWPRIDNENGLVNEEESLPDLPTHYFPVASPNDHFDNDTLGLKWNMIRSMKTDFYDLTSRPGWLRLAILPETIADDHRTPSFIERRQQHEYVCAGTSMEFIPASEAEEAGLCLIQSNEFNYIYTIKRQNGTLRLTLSKYYNDAECVDCEYLDTNIVKVSMSDLELPDYKGKIYLYVQGERETYSFYYGFREGEHIPFLTGVDGTLLSTNVAGGFVGAYMGMYCSSNGAKSDNHADFDWFDYSRF